MSYFERRLNSLALHLFHALEANTQTKKHVLTAVGGIVATIGIWVVHLNFPYLFQYVVQIETRPIFFAAFALAFAPPFAAVFSATSLIYSEVNEPDDEEESGLMAGYFYRERAVRKWKIAIGAGIIAAVNLIFIVVTSD